MKCSELASFIEGLGHDSQGHVAMTCLMVIGARDGIDDLSPDDEIAIGEAITAGNLKYDMLHDQFGAMGGDMQKLNQHCDAHPEDEIAASASRCIGTLLSLAEILYPKL